MKLFLGYIFIINMFGFVIMHLDKSKAKNGQWRIPEKTLFIIAVLLGSFGILVGMYTFRHKTKHLKFVLGIPAILLIQVFVILNLYHICLNRIL